ncbi:MAG: phage tail tape measure protein, partial [Symbiobacteriaceae bacterium]|nr:phage tail tape measure protein [Symbiobacteriaceae bacterium]
MADKSKVMEVAISILGQIDPSVAKWANEAIKSLDKINLKSVALGAAAVGATIAIGKGALQAGKALLSLGKDFNAAQKSIRISTGATGQALQGLYDDFNTIYKSVPTTMENVSLAVSDYNSLLGLSGEPLQELATQTLQLVNLVGDDLQTVIRNSSYAFQTWGVDAVDMTDTMDYVFRVSQATGEGFSDLLDKVTKYAPNLQEMGYSFESATALIGSMGKTGVNVDEVLGAMKKSVGALAKQGISASDGFAMYYKQILESEDATMAMNLASELFGSKAGPTMAAAIRNGSLAVGDFTTEMLTGGDTIAGLTEETMDFDDRLQLFKQNAQVALKPLANTIFDSLNKLMPTLTKSLDKLIPIIDKVVEAAAPFVEKFLELAFEAIDLLLPPLITLVDALLPILASIFEALMPILKPVIDIFLFLLDSIILPLLKPLTELIEAIMPVLIGL